MILLLIPLWWGRRRHLLEGYSAVGYGGYNKDKSLLRVRRSDAGLVRINTSYPKVPVSLANVNNRSIRGARHNLSVLRCQAILRLPVMYVTI